MKQLGYRSETIRSACGPIETAVERHYDEITNALEAILDGTQATKPFATTQLIEDYPAVGRSVRIASRFAPRRSYRDYILEVAERTVYFGLCLGEVALSSDSLGREKLSKIDLNAMTTVGAKDYIMAQPAAYLIFGRFSRIIEPLDDHCYAAYAAENMMGALLTVMDQTVASASCHQLITGQTATRSS